MIFRNKKARASDQVEELRELLVDFESRRSRLGLEIRTNEREIECLIRRISQSVAGGHEECELLDKMEILEDRQIGFSDSYDFINYCVRTLNYIHDSLVNNLTCSSREEILELIDASYIKNSLNNPQIIRVYLSKIKQMCDKNHDIAESARTALDGIAQSAKERRAMARSGRSAMGAIESVPDPRAVRFRELMADRERLESSERLCKQETEKIIKDGV